ncbi:MAG: hypothetical protein ABR557_06490 [Pyrinomonadaceae bacterium]
MYDESTRAPDQSLGDEKLLEDMARRVRARPELMRRRQQLAEAPFGTIKRAMGHGYFLTRV